jgi:hypothetical protein
VDLFKEDVIVVVLNLIWQIDAVHVGQQHDCIAQAATKSILLAKLLAIILLAPLRQVRRRRARSWCPAKLTWLSLPKAGDSCRQPTTMYVADSHQQLGLQVWSAAAAAPGYQVEASQHHQLIKVLPEQ